MATARQIKNRIRSVKNISQITRALEAVSASRVRKAQARVLASRAFAEKAWEILLNIQSMSTRGLPLHPLLTERSEEKQVMIVLVTSDRGLAGAYNANIIRVAQRFADRLGKPVRFVTIGRKGRDSLIRSGANVVAEFSDIPSDIRAADLTPVARLAIDEFLSGQVDAVFVAYTDFINTLTQRPTVLSWLPLTPYDSGDQVVAEFVKDVPQITPGTSDYEYEPNAAAILDEIVPRFTELQLYQAVLESQASEHSARMVAMRNASDNATSLSADLTLIYNKARQAAITNEILDIVGGAEALQASMDALADDIFAASEPTAVTRTKPQQAQSDDLTRIEGIGPKTATALYAAGILTFARLAESTDDELRAVLQNAGLRFTPSLVTWREQAEYAARADWDGLEAFQGQLVAGRRS